jgi:hypothetical protein
MANAVTWSVVLIGLLLVAFMGVAFFKKRLVQNEDVSGPGFTLADLRQLHRGGKMSDEEFEKAKQVIVHSIGKKTDAKPDATVPREIAPGPRLEERKGDAT